MRGGATARFSMNLVTSRGCPFHCNWCAKPIWGQRYDVRSPEDVVEEIAALRALGAEHLWFMDDILGTQAGLAARVRGPPRGAKGCGRPSSA